MVRAQAPVEVPKEANSQGTGEVIPFTLAYSADIFTEINENDATASVRVWTQAIARRKGIPVNAAGKEIRGTDSMIEELRTGKIDAATMLTDEFKAVSRRVAFSHLFVAVVGGDLTEEYVVLVHKDSAPETLAQLQGHTLMLFRNPRNSLAETWLETQLLKAGSPKIPVFFGRIQRPAKLSSAILPVFFKQADACLVTRRGFDVMRELNPQVGRQLRVIAASPPLVPMVLAMRSGYESELLDEIVASMRDLHKTPEGRQILTVFQCERVEEVPMARLGPSLSLLDEHEKLLGSVAASKSKSIVQAVSAEMRN